MEWISESIALWLSNARGFWFGRKELRIVFVLDELDKIQDDSHVDKVLDSLKNIFSCPGVSVIAVAGIEIYHRAQESAIQHIGNVFGSTVTSVCYLPRMWRRVHSPVMNRTQTWQFLELLMAEETKEMERKWCQEELQWYLEYVGRGIPRKVVAELEKFVTRQDGKRVLCFDGDQREVVERFSALQRELHNQVFKLDNNNGQLYDRDMRWMEVYRLLDYVLGRPCDVKERFVLESDAGKARFVHENAWDYSQCARVSHEFRFRSLENVRLVLDTAV